MMKIFINKLTKITDSKCAVGYQHNMPFDEVNGIKHENETLYTQEELEALGGKVIDYEGDLSKKLFYNPITNTLFSEDNDLQTVKENKVKEITELYNKEIYGTFKSNAFDGSTVETYSCNQVDQMRINGEVTMATVIKAGFSNEQISWKNVNQDICVPWTPDAMLKLGVDLHAFVTAKTDRLEALIVNINKCATVDDINKITWNTELS